jgi:hypothetical protein
MSGSSTLHPRTEKGFQFAADVSKQVLTLSSGLLALSVTFAKPMLEGDAAGSTWLLACVWTAFALSIVMGVLTLMRMTGELAALDKPNVQIWTPGLRAFALLQLSGFWLARSAPSSSD